MKSNKLDIKSAPVEYEEPFAESLSQLMLTIVVVIVILLVIGVLFYLVLEQHK
jgi:membrane-bound ClpP family serine protease